jgi:hypothetical protein
MFNYWCSQQPYIHNGVVTLYNNTDHEVRVQYTVIDNTTGEAKIGLFNTLNPGGTMNFPFTQGNRHILTIYDSTRPYETSVCTLDNVQPKHYSVSNILRGPCGGF